MRQVSQAEFARANAALACYTEYCKPYVQKNGWTVIPADAPRPSYDGTVLDCVAVNAFSTAVELFRLQHDKPERFSAYSTQGDVVTSWTGERVAVITWRGKRHTNNMGGHWRAISIRADWGDVYNGREYDSRQLVNFRKAKT